ncbi:MAG TPA: RES domain-containing protein [Rubrivivax sp.]|nr:RES domain-containing protein [Rubrivivax sp.]
MAKLGSPPAAQRLRGLHPDWATLRAGRDTLARIYCASGAHPVARNAFRAWGPAHNARFDHHLPDASGAPCLPSPKVFYGAQRAITCLAEVFQATRVVNRVDDDPFVCVFSPVRDLKLLDLTGRFATRMGASLAIHSGPRGRARAWARALYEAFDHDGLLYLSSMDAGAPAIALNERAENAMPTAPLSNQPLADPLLTDLTDALTHRLGCLKR